MVICRDYNTVGSDNRRVGYLMGEDETHIILGQGVTAIATARYWVSRRLRENQTVESLTVPSIQILSNKPNILPDDLRPYYSNTLQPGGNKRVWVSPGLKASDELFQQVGDVDPRYRMLDIDYFLSQVSTKTQVILVTGTNGKSTVSLYLQQILQTQGYSCACYGNFQPGVLQALDGRWDWVVLELSSYQLYWMKDRAWCIDNHPQGYYPVKASVLLNIEEDHLSWHEGYRGYRAAKEKVHQYADVCVDNGQYGGRSYLPGVKQIMLGSRQNQSLQTAMNMSAAWACLFHLGVVSQIDPLELGQLQGLPFRQQKRVMGERVIINDSKATNISATLSAIQAVRAQYENQKVLLILAGVSKVTQHQEIKQCLSAVSHIDCVVIGDDFQDMNDMLLARYRCIEDLKIGIVKSYGVILFSPAGASYDRYKDFSARGVAFDTHIESLCSS